MFTCHFRHLLENGEIMQAVELLRKSDKPFAAGKLLAMVYYKNTFFLK